MLTILRIFFTGGFAYILWRGAQEGPGAGAGDVTGAYYLGLSLMFAIATGIVWAPAVGAMVSAPLDATFTSGTFIVEEHKALRLVYWLIKRKHERLAVFFCALEAINHPDWPTAYNVGLRIAKPGSWWEKVFAREVWRFDNLQNAILAYETLRRHGIEPPEHANPQVRWHLSMRERKETPIKPAVPLPAAPPPPELKRNPKIRLFSGEGATPDACELDGDAPAAMASQSGAPAREQAGSQSQSTDTKPHPAAGLLRRPAGGGGFLGWLRKCAGNR
jgi:hypothetical protein